MTIASIDIGTNTVLLLIARVADDGSLAALLQEQRTPRLGRGVDAARRLTPDAMHRVAGVLEEYTALIARFPVDAVTVCATSAVRGAANRQEFLQFLRAATGFTVDVLTGEEEALWTFRGACSGFPAIDRATVVDIGGGSTEVSVGTAGTVTGRLSIELGAVRMTERYLSDDPPTAEQLASCRDAVDLALQPLAGLDTAGTTLVGVAGTPTTLAHLDQELRELNIHAISGYRLSASAVDRHLSRLSTLRAQEILKLSSALEGRADIITAGTLILQRVMRRLGQSELLVSERGVRYGLVLREWERRSTRG